jgi:eukaryotic-like serine/threonine-protein kinase
VEQGVLDLTHTGDLIGTFRYMPPEAFESKSDMRSDVYGLGITLYELVALRPAFDERDRNKLIKLVTTTEPPRLGKLRSGVPRDLETIIHKAIAPEPAHRYQKAEELAEDLRRFLEDRPIRARRTSSVERMARWARRNPAVASLLGVVAVLLLAISIASSLVAVRMTGLALSEETARQQAVAEGQAAIRTGERERWERYRANISAASAALELQASDAARQALEAAPEEHRNWEWRHFYNQLDGASRVLSIPDFLRGKHDAFALRPDGGQVAAGNGRNIAYVWDVNSTTVQPTHVLRGHTKPIFDIAYSPDGRQLATSSSDSVRLWDSATAQQLFELAAGANPVLRYSADSTRLLTNEKAAGGKYRLWDTTTGKLVAVIGDSLGPEVDRDQGIIFSPDGRRIAAAAGKEVRLYDARTGRRLLSLGPHEWAVEGVYFSADGKRVCAQKFFDNGPNAVYLWNVDTGRLVAKLTAPRTMVEHAAFSPDSAYLATPSQHPENLVRLWDPATGKLLHTLAGHTNSLDALCFSPNCRKLLTSSGDNTARLWDVQTGAEIAVLRGHAASVGLALFSPDGTRILTGSSDHTLRLWDARNGDLITVLRGHEGPCVFAQYTPDGAKVISFATDGTVRVWDMNLLERNGVFRGHKSFVYDVAFSPDGEQVASAAWDGTARLWDATTGRQTGVLPHQNYIVSSVAYSPDGTLLASVSRGDDHAYLWDLKTLKRRRLISTPTGEWEGDVRAVFDPTGRLLAVGSRDGNVRLWDARTGASVGVLQGPSRYALDVAFRPDGQKLASGGLDDKLYVWDLGTRTAEVIETGGINYRIAYSPNGKRIASRAGLFDAETHEKLADLPAGILIHGVAFSPDGSRLAVACRDNTIRLVDVATRQQVAELRGHTQYVHAVAWSPDGTRLVSGSGDGTLRIWDSLSVQERAKRGQATP